MPRKDFFHRKAKTVGSRVAFFLMAALLVAGCVTTRPSRLYLPAAPLPTYTAGDSYHYTNGRRDTVIAANGSDVIWADREGKKRIRSRNFVLTTSQWKMASDVRAADPRGPDSLWPLLNRRTAEFVAVGRSANKTWSCRVTTARETQVPAGKFEVFRVRCRTESSETGAEERIWYYAPNLGHFVRYQYKKDGKTRRRYDLIAVRPSPSRLPVETRDRFVDLLQTALETTISGDTVDLPEEGGAPAVEIHLIATFRNEAGLYCRNFVETLKWTDRATRYPGLACREGDSVWRIPTGS